MPLTEIRERQALLRLLLSIVRCRSLTISYKRLLAALQIAVISTGHRPPRKRSLEWCGFLPAFSSSVARLGEGGIVLSAVAEAMAD